MPPPGKTLGLMPCPCEWHVLKALVLLPASPSLKGLGITLWIADMRGWVSGENVENTFSL